ncbi:671_t:CDS:2, partial [Cetraspora pellucida]
LPSSIKAYNDGKGVPIEYTLYPLSELSKILSQNFSINRVIKDLDDDTIERVDRTFTDLFKSKQKLYDLYNDANLISHFIPDKLFNEINNFVQNVNSEETKFRRKLSECLINIRSGKKDINKLEDMINEFQQSVLSETSITLFINKHKSISTKADLLPILKARGIDYHNKNLTINQILLEHTRKHIYIFYDTDYILNIDSPVWNAFLNISSINEGSNKFFIVDPILLTGTDRPNHPVIYHYINGCLDSKDYYNENKKLFTSNIIKFNTLPCIKPNYIPNKKDRLIVPCPCSLMDDCLPLNLEWICFRCLRYIEYGYNEHLYCKCGEIKIDHCRFKCNSSFHIGGYISFDQTKLADYLPLVAPQEVINILLLGETGAGKSTFINAFANYFKFNNLDEAISDEDENDYNVGESSTKECGVYVFHAGENQIRLIDTPGIGDTRGIEYDKRNFENILKNISLHEYLNGICILLKPNNTRLNMIFKYCMQELLSHLHKSAKDNIVFCFTNTRETFFRTGDTLPVFLAAIKNNVSYSENTKKNHELSWNNSVEESIRLLKHIINCTPHKIIDTVSINNARQTVMIFCEPLAKVNQNIQENIAKVKKLKEEIQTTDLTEEELRSKLYVPHIELKITLLKQPRIVCKNCKIQKIDITMRYCHVKWKILTKFMLKYHGTMMFGKCKSCGCSAKSHEAVFYESISEYSKKVDETIKNKILENKENQNNKQDHIGILQDKIDQLKEEQSIVDEIIIQFTQFLMQNAIAVFNDAYMEYLDYIIHLEKNKNNEDYNNEILEGLEETKRKYDEKVKVIKKMIENNDSSSHTLSSEDIFKLEQKLYNLPDIGQYLQDVKKEEKKAFKYREKHYELPNSVLKTLKPNFKN